MQDEQTLLNRARALDPEALTAIHDRYYVPVYRYISFRISNPQVAEDLTSEVFTRFLSAIRDRSAPPNTIRGWLYGAAANVVKEQYRRQRRENAAPLDEEIQGTMTTPEQRLDEQLQRRELRAALGSLSEEQQHVLALRFGEGMSVRDVAQAVNKSEGAVKMLQVRAIKALTQRLTGVEVGS